MLESLQSISWLAAVVTARESGREAQICQNCSARCMCKCESAREGNKLDKYFASQPDSWQSRQCGSPHLLYFHNKSTAGIPYRHSRSRSHNQCWSPTYDKNDSFEMGKKPKLLKRRSISHLPYPLMTPSRGFACSQSRPIISRLNTKWLLVTALSSRLDTMYSPSGHNSKGPCPTIFSSAKPGCSHNPLALQTTASRTRHAVDIIIYSIISTHHSFPVLPHSDNRENHQPSPAATATIEAMPA